MERSDHPRLLLLSVPGDCSLSAQPYSVNCTGFNQAIGSQNARRELTQLESTDVECDLLAGGRLSDTSGTPPNAARERRPDVAVERVTSPEAYRRDKSAGARPRSEVSQERETTIATKYFRRRGDDRRSAPNTKAPSNTALQNRWQESPWRP